jgi:predicted methyltransferase
MLTEQPFRRTVCALQRDLEVVRFVVRGRVDDVREHEVRPQGRVVRVWEGHTHYTRILQSAG